MNFSDDRGSAIIDFLGYGLILQIPILLFAVQLNNLQSNQLVAESIARHSLRSYVLQGIAPQATANQVIRDFAAAGNANTDLSCDPDCLSDGSLIRLRVSFQNATATSVMVR